MWVSKATPQTEPGMLPAASAITTLRRTVPFFRCKSPAGILVKKLKSASDPTAMIAGTFRPKISTGSSRTPPPTPVRPMRMPTTKPTRILTAISVIATKYVLLPGSGNADEAFAFQVQNDLLGCFLRRPLARIDNNLSVGRNFVGVRDTRELLEDSSSSLGVQALPIALLADFDRSGDVNQDEPPVRLHHLAHVFTGRVIGRDGRTNSNTAVLCDLRSHVSDSADIDVAMLFRESELRRKMLAHQVSGQQCEWTA